jgi:AraC-like DNA-binding protein
VLRYFARPPAAPLARFVEYLWASQGAPAHAKERVVPTGTVELAVDLGSGVGVVAGAYRRQFTFDTRENASVVGVHFRPGCAATVLGLPVGELTDQHVDLDALWGRRSREFRERLCAATTTEQRFVILETELSARLDRRPVHPAVRHAIEVLARPDVRVGDLARRAGLNQRTMIQAFTAAVGLTPKRFGRVLRFQRAIALARSASLDWTRVAHECGYYDQAHLIRDFRELAGVTPGDLMRATPHVQEQHQFAVSEK